MRPTFHHALWAVLSATAIVAGAVMPSPTLAATFVYVGNTESNEIYVLQLDRQNGELTVVEKVPIPGVTKPGISTPMAVSPDRRVLYAGTRGEPQIVAGFSIDPASGKLKHIANGPLADSMAYIATDRTGRFLLGASYPGHKVTVSPIGPQGGGWRDVADGWREAADAWRILGRATASQTVPGKAGSAALHSEGNGKERP